MRFFVYLWSRRACNFCHDLWQRHMRTLFVGNVAYVVKWICYRKFVACLWPCISGFWWWTHMLIYAFNFAAFTGQLMGYIVFVRLTEVADFKSTSGTSMINPTKIIKTYLAWASFAKIWNASDVAICRRVCTLAASDVVFDAEVQARLISFFGSARPISVHAWEAFALLCVLPKSFLQSVCRGFEFEACAGYHSIDRPVASSAVSLFMYSSRTRQPNRCSIRKMIEISWLILKIALLLRGASGQVSSHSNSQISALGDK